VPDASWDQLEEFRRGLREVHAACPDFRYIYLLLGWMRQHDQDDPERGIYCLQMSDALERDLVDWIRRHAPSFEDRVREMVLDQLGERPPCAPGDDEYVYRSWELKRQTH